MKFQPNLKHTMYNLGKALKVIIPLSIVELAAAMLRLHAADKAIAKAYTAGQENAFESMEKDSDIEAKEV